MMRKIVLILGVCLFFVACHNEPHHKLQGRLDDFSSLLNAKELSLFNKKAYQQAADLFDKRIASSKKVNARYLKIKQKENIVIFTTVQVFRFFGDTMRQKIKFHRSIKNGK